MEEIRTQEVLQPFDELMSDLQAYAAATEPKRVQEVLELGAQALVKQLDKLPYPIIKIRAPGHTHLVDSFTYGVVNNGRFKGQVEVGWGVYYGPMVEHGTKLGGNGAHGQKAQPHIEPTWRKNKEKIYALMLKKAGLTK